MFSSKFDDGVIVIWDDPDPVTWLLVTLIVSTVALPVVFLIVIVPPLSASTFSLKLRTIVELSATPVASSSGTDEVNVGIVFTVVKLKASVSLGIPAYDLPSTSSKAVGPIKT